MLSFDAFITESFMDPKVAATGANKIVAFLNSKGYSFSRFGGINYYINFVKKIVGVAQGIKSSQMIFVSPEPTGPCISFNYESSRKANQLASVNVWRNFDGDFGHPDIEIVVSSVKDNLTSTAKALLATLGLFKGQAVTEGTSNLQEIRRDNEGRIADPERRAAHEKGLKERLTDIVDEMQLYGISVNEVLGQNAINISDEVPDDLPEEDAMVQYKDLKEAIRALAAEHHKCVFVCGTAGVGKTYNVTKELKQLGVPYHKVSGNITSASAAYEILYDNRHEGTVLLVDDCDSMFNPANINLLKAALGEADGPGGDYRVSYVSGSTLDVSRWPLDKVEFYTQLFDAQKAADEDLFDRLCAEIGVHRGGGDDEAVSESVEEDDEEEEAIGDGEDMPLRGPGYFPKEIMKALERGRPLQRPSTFQFLARAIFITNIPPSNFRRDPHLKAVLDRGELVPIVLDQKMVFQLLENILPSLKHLKVNLTVQEKQDLLDVVKKWYTQRSNDHFPSIRTFVLLFPHRKSGGDWQAYVERALKNKAG